MSKETKWIISVGSKDHACPACDKWILNHYLFLSCLISIERLQKIQSQIQQKLSTISNGKLPPFHFLYLSPNPCARDAGVRETRARLPGADGGFTDCISRLAASQ